MVAQLVMVGGGNMGEALAAGLIHSGWAPAPDITVVEKLPQRRKELEGAHPGLAVSADVPAEVRDAVIAVKPGDVDDACASLATAGVRRVLSIAAGVTIERLQRRLGSGIRVVRAMPNMPALVGAGAAAIAPGSEATDDDLEWAAGILAAVGTVVRVSEKLLDAVTGLSGSGPAYVFLVAEAMVEAGVLVGLPRDVATALTVQTLLGSAQLLARSAEGPTALRFAVTSPGGTTAAGLQALESAAVRAAFVQAVAAATERSRELGAGEGAG
jgi:pyrroline-5-carboxylate reductase